MRDNKRGTIEDPATDRLLALAFDQEKQQKLLDEPTWPAPGTVEEAEFGPAQRVEGFQPAPTFAVPGDPNWIAPGYTPEAAAYEKRTAKAVVSLVPTVEHVVEHNKHGGRWYASCPCGWLGAGSRMLTLSEAQGRGHLARPGVR